jgi:RHS repeat-associated protein
MRYYPYGEERTTTADGREKFGTYMRDSTGQDYADQRYYNVGTGRFMTPDPSYLNIDLGVPKSWNMHAYVGGDPINVKDATGLAWSFCDVNPLAPQCTASYGTSGGPGTGGGQVACDNTKYDYGCVEPGGGSYDPEPARAINQQNLEAGVNKLLDKTKCSSFVESVLRSAFLDVNQVTSPDQLTSYTREIYDHQLTTAVVVGKLVEATIVDGGKPPEVKELEGLFTVTARASFESNTITVFDPFFSRGTTGQAQVALHEAMHLVWNIGDVNYAKAAGVYKEGMSGSAASAAWNKKLEENCK